MRNGLQSVVDWLKTIFEEQKPTQQKGSIAVLDGVRGLAIFFVISYHIDYSLAKGHMLDWHSSALTLSILTAGSAGVSLFFVLSGFLLFMPYAKALLFADRWPLARTFYLRRALRIFPGYYISLFILILLEERNYLLPSGWPKLGLFLSFFMDSTRLTFRVLNGPYWTLAVEWQFYMILPLMMLGVLLLVRRVPIQKRLRAVTFCLLGIIALGLLVRIPGFYFRDHPKATFLLPRHAINVIFFFIFGIVGKYTEEFAVGMLASLCYIYAQRLPAEHRFPRFLRRWSSWFWGVGLLILVFYAMWRFQSDPNTPAWSFMLPFMPYYTWLSEMVVTWGFGLCIVAILFGPPSLQRMLTWAPLRWVGLISYSLYIWHLPMLQFLLFLLAHLPSLPYYATFTLYWLWTLIVTTPLCLLIYIVIEKPGMKLGDRWRKAIEARHRARVQSADRQPVSGGERVELADAARSS